MNSERYTPQEALNSKKEGLSELFQQNVQIFVRKIEQSLRSHISFNKKKNSISIENTDTDEMWTKDKFSIENEIKLRDGPLIEIGGPTVSGFDLVNFDSLDKKIFTSNITPGCPLHDIMTGDFLGYIGKIDFQADAQRLPFKDNGIGVLFASCLPFKIRKNVIHEAKRVLEKNGLLVWQAGTENDIIEAKLNGFELMQYNKRLYGLVYNWNMIFRKKIDIHAILTLHNQPTARL